MKLDREFCKLELEILEGIKEGKLDIDVDKMSKEDYYNMVLMYIINRANSFNRKKYDCFVIRFLEDTPRYQLFYNCIKIIAVHNSMNAYFPGYKADKMPWFDKNISVLKRVDMVKLTKKKKNKGLCFNIMLDEEIEGLKHMAFTNPRIFEGVSAELIEEIIDIFFRLEKPNEKLN